MVLRVIAFIYSAIAAAASSAGTVVLFFLSVQSLTLAHAHSCDLQKHVDCTLCLKIGFGHDIIPASSINFVIPTLRQRFNPVFETAIVIANVPAKARAPPFNA